MIHYSLEEEEVIKIPEIENYLEKHIQILHELTTCKEEEELVTCRKFLCPIYNGFITYNTKIPKQPNPLLIPYQLAKLTTGDLYGQDQQGDIFIDPSKFNLEMKSISKNLVVPNETGTIVLFYDPSGPKKFEMFSTDKQYTNIICQKSIELITVLQLGRKLMDDIINLHQLEDKILHLANPLKSQIRKRSVASFLFGGDSSALLAQQVEQRFAKLVRNINKNLVKPTINAERLLAQNLKTEESEIINLHNVIEGSFFKSFWESQHPFNDFKSFVIESELMINRFTDLYKGLENLLISQMEGKEFSCEYHRILNKKQTCVKLNTLRFSQDKNKELSVQYSLVKLEQNKKIQLNCEFSAYNESMVNALHNAVLDPEKAILSLEKSETQPLRNLTKYEYFAPNTLLLTSGDKIGFSCAIP